MQPPLAWPVKWLAEGWTCQHWGSQPCRRENQVTIQCRWLVLLLLLPHQSHIRNSLHLQVQDPSAPLLPQRVLQWPLAGGRHKLSIPQAPCKETHQPHQMDNTVAPPPRQLDAGLQSSHLGPLEQLLHCSRHDSGLPEHTLFLYL